MENVYCLQVGSHVGDSPNDTLFVQDFHFHAVHKSRE